MVFIATSATRLGQYSNTHYTSGTYPPRERWSSVMSAARRVFSRRLFDVVRGIIVATTVNVCDPQLDRSCVVWVNACFGDWSARLGRMF